MIGAVRGIDRNRPLLRRHQALHRSHAEPDGDESAVYEGNARRVFTRLDKALKAKGLTSSQESAAFGIKV
jgi:4-oxalmesaconate hydratase